MAAFGNKTYIIEDDHGVLRVGQMSVSLDSILAAWQQGHSPETIRSQYPALSLEEVYGAITWCLAHSDEVEKYQKRQNGVWEQARALAERDLPPVVRRLREVSKARSST